jgi:pantothenate kinase
MPRDFDPTFYGFRTREEAECEFSRDIIASDYVDIPVDSVRSWLAYRRNIFLERQAFENEKKQQRHQREMFELQVRSQEMAKWQMEREEERGVRVKISKRKRLLKWLKQI